MWANQCLIPESASLLPENITATNPSLPNTSSEGVWGVWKPRLRKQAYTLRTSRKDTISKTDHTSKIAIPLFPKHHFGSPHSFQAVVFCVFGEFPCRLLPGKRGPQGAGLNKSRTSPPERGYVTSSVYLDLPKPAILIGCPIINHPFWGTPIFGDTHTFAIKLSQM